MAKEPSFLGVIERLKAEGQLDRNSGSNSIKTLKQINVEGFNSLFNSMNELVDFFKGNDLQDEENRRELLQSLKGGKKEEKKEEKKTKSDGFEIPGLEGILGVVAAGITGLLAGFVVGLGQNFVSVLKFLGKSLNKALIKPILNFIKRTKTFGKLKGGLLRLVTRIKGIVGAIRNFTKNGKVIKNLKSGLQLFVRNIKMVVNAISGFVKNSKILKSLKLFKTDFVKALKPVLNIFKAIPKAFGSISGLIGNVIPGGGGGLMKLFSPLKGFFETFGKVLPKFFKLGKVFGRLFLPFTVITSLIDFIKGAFGGFQKYKDKGFIEGLIGGLLGGISGLATGLIGMPLDLLKSAVSWVAGKLGFENFAEMLDSFSFSELIGGLFTKVTDIIVGFISSIKESIANIGIGGMIKNISLNLLKIFKKIASFPSAVVAGAGAALAAAMPGGKTPMEAFKEGFSAVFNAGDAKIDSLKAVSSGGSGGSEAGDDALAIQESAAVPGVTGFSEDQQAALGLLKDALADADTEDKRLKIAGKFRAFKIDEDKQGTEGLFSDEFNAEQAKLFAQSRNNTGAQMEVGMSNIADAKAQPSTVVVSGGGGGGAGQNTTVNAPSVTFNGSNHADESSVLSRPMTTMAYGF